jgi:hypothetical protein
MDMTTHRGRITGPIAYRLSGGRELHIPMGPCLVEGLGRQSIDIIWGAQGQRCVALPLEDVQAAHSQGNLVLID